MKQRKIIKYILIIAIIIISLLSAKRILTISKKENQGNQENIIQENQIEESISIEETEETEQIEEVNLQYSEEIIGTLQIPKLEIDAQIKEGIDLEILANYIGHFKNSSLWDGNVALASHNRGSSVAHYFEGIHLLDEGDEIIYKTNMGERRYQVCNIKKIISTDWSVTLQTEENMLTLITCITGEPQNRLCVQAKEV